MKKFQIGDLDSRISILAATNAIDDSGNMVAAPYEVRCVVWANIYDKDAGIMAANGEVIHDIMTEITVRYNPGIIQTDVVDHDGRHFEQVGPPIHIGREWTRLTCREAVGYGSA
jgi:head-tail adaptor